MCELHLTVGIMSRTAVFKTLCVKGGTHPKNPDFLEQNVGKNAHAERFAELSTRLTAVAASTNLSAPFHN